MIQLSYDHPQSIYELKPLQPSTVAGKRPIGTRRRSPRGGGEEPAAWGRAVDETTRGVAQQGALPRQQAAGQGAGPAPGPLGAGDRRKLRWPDGLTSTEDRDRLLVVSTCFNHWADEFLISMCEMRAVASQLPVIEEFLKSKGCHRFVIRKLFAHDGFWIASSIYRRGEYK